MEAKLKTQGMHCDGNAKRVKSLLEKEPGVREAEVSHSAGEARVRYNEHTVTVDRLREVVDRTGYGAEELA